MKNRTVLRVTAILLLIGVLSDFCSECYVPYGKQSTFDFHSIKLGQASAPSAGLFLFSRLNEGESEYHRSSLHAVDIQLSNVSVLTNNHLSCGICTTEVKSSELFSPTGILILEHRFII